MRTTAVSTILAAALLVASQQCVFTKEAGMKPEDYLSSKTISVRQNGKQWVIKGAHRAVTLSESDLAVTVKSGANLWTMRPSQPDELTIESDGKRSTMALTSAGRLEVSPYDTGRLTGVKITLADFKGEGKPLDCSLQLFICLEGTTEELVCEVVPTEVSARIKELRWPKAFEPTTVDATVIPAMQGMLLPTSWPRAVFLYDPMTYGRGLYMPWWGAQKGKAAAVLILETPEDAGCYMTHPAGGPTLMEVKWVHSLGKLGYARRARIAFFDEGDYVTCAKRYRTHVIDTGKFISLKEKIARSPIVAKLIGSPVVHTGILTNIQPASNYYDKADPAKNHQFVTFDARAAELEKLAKAGVKRAYVHLDGWGFRGYDNLHPDILPPSPEAGGYEAMKRLADTCDKLGYVFAIHDQVQGLLLRRRVLSGAAHDHQGGRQSTVRKHLVRRPTVDSMLQPRTGLRQAQSQGAAGLRDQAQGRVPRCLRGRAAGRVLQPRASGDTSRLPEVSRRVFRYREGAAWYCQLRGTRRLRGPAPGSRPPRPLRAGSQPRQRPRNGDSSAAFQPCLS